MKNPPGRLIAALSILCLLLVLSGNNTYAFETMKGTDSIESISYKDTTCYASKKYIAVEATTPSSDTIRVHVFPRTPQMALKKCCSGSSGKPILTLGKDDTNCFFMGFFGDTAIMDCGTGPDLRQLMVMNIKSKALLLDSPYVSENENSVLLRDGKELEWFASVTAPTPKPDCPQAAEWESQGFSVLYKQQRTLDLQSGKTADKGAVTCTMGQ